MGRGLHDSHRHENLIVHARHENPSYREFFKRDMPRAEEMKQFGEMGVLETTKKIFFEESLRTEAFRLCTLEGQETMQRIPIDS